MRVLTGDETGLIKNVNFEKDNQIIINSNDPQSRNNAILKMSWCDDRLKRNFIVARNNGIIEEWDLEDNKQKHRYQSRKEDINYKYNIIGLDVIQNDIKKSILSCTKEGNVQIDTIRKDPVDETPISKSFSIGKDISCMKLINHSKNNIISGGKEMDLSIWDIETQKNIFKAKNVSHDNLDMRVPIWIKSIDIINKKENTINNIKAVTSTAYNQIRIYDTKAQKKPVHDISFGDYPINNVIVTPEENKIIVTDTVGNINAIDLKTLRTCGRYPGPVGAVRSLVCHATLPYFAAVGLDRMVYLYHKETRKLHQQIYLKQRQNSVLFTDDGVISNNNNDKNQSRNDDMEDNDNINETENEDDLDESEEEYEGLEIDNHDDMMNPNKDNIVKNN